MQSSKLQNLAIKLTDKIALDPETFIEKLIPLAYKPMYLKFRCLLPVMENLFKTKLDPTVAVVQAARGLDSLPPEIWLQLEDLLRAVLDGDQETANELSNKLFGVNFLKPEKTSILQ